jgi:transposase
MGVDVGENNLAAISLGKVWAVRIVLDRRDRHLAPRRRLLSNGSQSAKQKLRQVSLEQSALFPQGLEYTFIHKSTSPP